MRLLLLAAFCGEHLLLLGPPGTAKSELGRRLSRICQGTYFERLLTRFSVPEARARSRAPLAEPSRLLASQESRSAAQNTFRASSATPAMSELIL